MFWQAASSSGLSSCSTSQTQFQPFAAATGSSSTIRFAARFSWSTSRRAVSSSHPHFPSAVLRASRTRQLTFPSSSGWSARGRHCPPSFVFRRSTIAPIAGR